MTQRKKPSNAGKGRKPRITNRPASNAREAIARLVDGNVDRLLNEIAKEEGPKAAGRCFVDLLERRAVKY